MNKSAEHIVSRMLGDAHFLYTAFAPMLRNSRVGDRQRPEESPEVLVKVGISTTPMRRLVDVGCGCPFRIAYAAFAPTFSGKRKAERIETRLLDCFRDFRTRGEWLLLPNTPDMRKEFSAKARALLQDETSRPVGWTRVTGNEIAEFMLAKRKREA